MIFHLCPVLEREFHLWNPGKVEVEITGMMVEEEQPHDMNREDFLLQTVVEEGRYISTII